MTRRQAAQQIQNHDAVSNGVTFSVPSESFNITHSHETVRTPPRCSTRFVVPFNPSVTSTSNFTFPGPIPRFVTAFVINMTSNYSSGKLNVGTLRSAYVAEASGKWSKRSVTDFMVDQGPLRTLARSQVGRT